MKPIIKRPSKGTYISFEGIEGVGKSHIISYIIEQANKFNNPAVNVVAVSEITRVGFGKDVIDLLARHDDQFFRCGYPLSEAMVFFSMKLFELTKTIVPHLECDNIVVEDRSADTNCAYAAVQLADQLSISPKDIYSALWEARTLLAFVPDKTILLLDDIEICLERAQHRDGRLYSESEQLLIRRVYKLFQEIAIQQKRIHVVDLTALSLADRGEKVWEVFQEMCFRAEGKGYNE